MPSCTSASSARRPYSMIDREHAVYTQVNNVVGNLNVMYAISRDRPDRSTSSSSARWGSTATPTSTSKRGSSRSPTRAGPTCCPTRSSPAPSTTCPRCTTATTSCSAAGSGACGATDLNQGIVYGQSTEETDLDPVLATRFDYDGVFGTVLNRFCVQAVTGHPLTVYGAGGQTRGMLNIRDTLACVALAIENPAERGEFRVFNQFTESFSVRDMAQMVKRVCPTRVDIAEGLSNPRVENEEHYFHAANTKLLDLGLEPHLLTDEVIARDPRPGGALPGPGRRAGDRPDGPVAFERQHPDHGGRDPRLFLPRGVSHAAPAVVSCGDVATQATTPRAPSITGPAGPPARCSGGRPRAPRGRPHPGVAAVAGLRRQLQPVARGAGCRRRRPVQRDRVRRAHARRQPAGTDPPVDPGGARQRRAADRRPGGAGGPRRRLAPSGSAAAEFAAVFADRARAVAELRAAIDGFLGHATDPDGRRPGHGVACRHVQHDAGRDARPPPRRRTSIAAAGALLARSDSLYRSVQTIPRRRDRTRQAPQVGLGDRPAAVAGGQRSRPRSTSWPRRRPWRRPTTSSCGPSASTHRRCRRRRARRPPSRPSAPRHRSA